MPWFLFVLFLCLQFSSLSKGRLEKKLPSAAIVGVVNCDTCYQQDSTKNGHFISGATIAVECKSDNSHSSFREELKTDEKGEFEVHLPLSISKDMKRIKACSVHLISSNQPYCSVDSTTTSSALHLQSRKQGEYIFSAGFLSFKPQNQPNICNQKPITRKFKQLNSEITSLPSFQSPLPEVNQGLSKVSLSRVKGKGKIYTVSANKIHHSNPNEAFTEQTFQPNQLQPTLPVPNPLEPTLPVPNLLQPIPNPLQPIPNPLQPTLPVPNPLQPIPNPLQPTLPVPNPLQPVPNPLQPTLPVPNPLQPTLPVPNPLQPTLPVPNPLQPTLPVPNPIQPTLPVPNPLQPPPLIPNPLQPPSTPLIPQPPLPGLTPPLPPSLPVPFPQLPLPPNPPFPGAPLARLENENLS